MIYSIEGIVKSCATLSAIFLVGTSLFSVSWSGLFDALLQSQMALSPTSVSFKTWSAPSLPMYYEIYLFNWTNAHKGLGPGVRPELEELGPYVFRVEGKKLVQSWNPGNHTVTFLQQKFWYFDCKLSNGSLNDVITTVNVPALTAAAKLRNSGMFLDKLMLNAAMKLNRVKLNVTKTAGEFLFDGYTDPLLNLASIVKMASDDPVPDKFGWFYGRNGSEWYDGIFNMNTGADNMTKFGGLASWNYRNTSKAYRSYCAQLNGSAGELFPPKRTKGAPVDIFIGDLCRSLKLEWREEVFVYGIKAFRYVGDQRLFDNGTITKENLCFFPLVNGKESCPPRGALDVAACKFGAPAYVSLPHFLKADPEYLKPIDGLNPNETKHSFFLDIEPQTGLPVRVSASVQINILVQPDSSYGILSDIQKLYLPVVWFRQKVEADSKHRMMLKVLSTASKLAHYRETL